MTYLLISSGAFLGVMLLARIKASNYRKKKFRILSALSRKLEGDQLYGLDLVRLGCGHMGTIFMTLLRMEDEGLVISYYGESTYPAPLGSVGFRHMPELKRRYYELTNKGRRYFEILQRRRLY